MRGASCSSAAGYKRAAEILRAACPELTPATWGRGWRQAWRPEPRPGWVAAALAQSLGFGLADSAGGGGLRLAAPPLAWGRRGDGACRAADLHHGAHRAINDAPRHPLARSNSVMRENRALADAKFNKLRCSTQPRAPAAPQLHPAAPCCTLAPFWPLAPIAAPLPRLRPSLRPSLFSAASSEHRPSPLTPHASPTAPRPSPLAPRPSPLAPLTWRCASAARSQEKAKELEQDLANLELFNERWGSTPR